ncbi:MAG: flagellar hook capping FlgD N-terminal domain-containing protein, partial [Candidatus Nanopelagicales bacterium]
MTVNPIGSSTTAPAASSPTASSKTDLGSDAFLKLMVAQLKYQDPMNPAQGTEFLAQTAQFTMVEKLSQLAQQNSDALSAQRALQAGGMIGKTVAFTDANGALHQGVATSARLLPSGPVLQVDGQDVPLSSIEQISTTTASAPSDTAVLAAVLADLKAELEALKKEGVSASSTTTPAVTTSTGTTAADAAAIPTTTETVASVPTT